MNEIYFKSQVHNLRLRAKLLQMYNATGSIPDYQLVLELERIRQELNQLTKDYNKKDYSTPSITKFL